LHLGSLLVGLVQGGLHIS